jgi:hypothetical protein
MPVVAGAECTNQLLQMPWLVLEESATLESIDSVHWNTVLAEATGRQ